MRAGKLDRVITIENFTYEHDWAGSPIHTWTALATMRAQIIQSTTEEFMRSWGMSSETALIFRTRYVEGVAPTSRVVFDGDNYNIREVKELGRRRGLEIRCVRAGS